MLIDTHILIWYLSGDSQHLGKNAIKILNNSHIVVSVASLLEITLKKRKGKLDIPEVSEITKVLTSKSIQILDITAQHLVNIPEEVVWAHGDPFDLLLASQAISERLEFMTNDLQIIKFTVPGLNLIDGRI